MQLATGNTIDYIYSGVADVLLALGKIVTVRGLRTKELINSQIRLSDPRSRIVSSPARNIDMRYLVGELCFFLDGRTDLASIAHYSKFWNKVSDDGKTVNSAYGNRLFVETPQHVEATDSQFQYAIWCLTKDAYSRKAVMTIYAPTDARESKDNPCTLTLQFMIRDGKLHMFTNMRSQDFWLGVPYDFAFFTLVQEIALIKLQDAYPRLTLGDYFHSVASLHVYENHWDDLKAIVCARKQQPVIMPELTKIDVSNWFDDLITYEKSKRGIVLYKNDSRRTAFQDWAKNYL